MSDLIKDLIIKDLQASQPRPLLGEIPIPSYSARARETRRPRKWWLVKLDIGSRARVWLTFERSFAQLLRIAACAYIQPFVLSPISLWSQPKAAVRPGCNSIWYRSRLHKLYQGGFGKCWCTDFGVSWKTKIILKLSAGMASFLMQANTARKVDQTERAYTTRTSRVLNIVGKSYGAGL